MGGNKNKYGLDVGRHKNHGYYIPWLFIAKLVIGLGLVAGAYYFARTYEEKATRQKNNSKPDNGIEVEIDQ